MNPIQMNDTGFDAFGYALQLNNTIADNGCIRKVNVYCNDAVAGFAYMNQFLFLINFFVIAAYIFVYWRKGKDAANSVAFYGYIVLNIFIASVMITIKMSGN